MAKPRKQKGRDRKDSTYQDNDTKVVNTRKELKAKNSEQKTYINAIKNTNVVVCVGQAGSGKTFIPSVLAAQELFNPNSPYDSIILIRPNEPLGKSLGMLPGDLKEKLEPWIAPIKDGIVWAVGKYGYEGMFRDEKIQYVAVEHVRGRTFNNAYVIVDEAQNIGIDAIKAIVGRIGMDCKMIICGDIAQKDIKAFSGLGLLMKIYEDREDYNGRIPFRVIELKDNVRSHESAMFGEIFLEYEDYGA